MQLPDQLEILLSYYMLFKISIGYYVTSEASQLPKSKGR